MGVVLGISDLKELLCSRFRLLLRVEQEFDRTRMPYRYFYVSELEFKGTKFNSGGL